jgi:hypothetical protein
MAEIANAFARNAGRSEQLEKRIERPGDRVQRVAADVQTAETGHAADNADASGVGRAQPFGSW